MHFIVKPLYIFSSFDTIRVGVAKTLTENGKYNIKFIAKKGIDWKETIYFV